MPDLNTIPVPLYEANQPYHWEFDNLPLKALKERDELINRELDTHATILADSIGTQGTLANRLIQSIDEDGNLKSAAVDETEHNIAEHTDGSKTVDSDLLEYINETLGYVDVVNPVPFIRMLQIERDKLAGIASEATNMTLQVEVSPSEIVLYEEGPVYLGESSSIGWQITAPNIVKPVLKISTDFAHRHYYDLIPIMVSDYTLYNVTNTNTVFIDGTLRVYINGIKLNSTANVYYPDSTATNWALNSFTSDFENGQFTLAYPITEDDVITIDFDLSLT